MYIKQTMIFSEIFLNPQLQDEESSGYDSFETEAGGGGGGHLSILNPCYSGPDLDTADHARYAATLNCPAPAADTGSARMLEAVELREKVSAARARAQRPRSEVLTTRAGGTGGGAARPVSDPGRGRGRGEMVMYVVGGREVGQINMFQRNISVWKLRL